MSRYAIISDIHGNFVALEAVLKDIESQGVAEIWCLGDVIGYGPQPVECWSRVKETCSITIMGNHEQALVPGGGERFNPRAKNAINWTRQQFEQLEDGAAILETLTTLPRAFEREGIMFVHASPADPTNEYLLPKVSRMPKRMARNFAAMDHYCFCGHTHIPGVIEEGEVFCPPEQMIGGTSMYLLDYTYKAIINVGSVGQPRDHNPKACYVIFDGDSVQYRRVPYSVQATRKRIHQIAMLDNFLGDRLLQAR